MRRGLALLGCLAIAFASTSARADATSCSKDAEDGQRLKASGRLREAREKFLACGVPACPQIVQRDCATWASEVLGMMPSIVVDARDANGADLADVVTYVDDKAVASTIDGKAIPIDPGPHKLRFTHPGFEPITQDIIAKEGVRSRVITVSFTRRGAAPPSSSPPTPPEEPRETGGGIVKYLPWVLVGAGVVTATVGVVFIATAPPLPPGCVRGGEVIPNSNPPKISEGSGTCGNLSTDAVPDDPATPQNENPQLAERQKEAGRSDEQPIYGAVFVAVGGVAIAGGLLWYFLKSSQSSAADRTPKVRPWLAREGGGLGFGTTF